MGNWKMGKYKKKSNSYTLQINENMKVGYNVSEGKIIQSVLSKRNYYLFN